MHFALRCIHVCLLLNNNITWTVTVKYFPAWRHAIASRELSQLQFAATCCNLWLSSLAPLPWVTVMDRLVMGYRQGHQMWTFVIHVSALCSVTCICTAAKANMLVAPGNSCTCPACPLMYMMDSKTCLFTAWPGHTTNTLNCMWHVWCIQPTYRHGFRSTQVYGVCFCRSWGSAPQTLSLFYTCFLPSCKHRQLAATQNCSYTCLCALCVPGG